MHEYARIPLRITLNSQIFSNLAEPFQVPEWGTIFYRKKTARIRRDTLIRIIFTIQFLLHWNFGFGAILKANSADFLLLLVFYPSFCQTGRQNYQIRG